MPFTVLSPARQGKPTADQTLNPNSPLIRSLKGAYLFNENIGLTVRDVAGSNKGTFRTSGAFWDIDPAIGICGKFDGSTQRVEIAGIPNVLSGFTALTRVRVDTLEATGLIFHVPVAAATTTANIFLRMNATTNTTLECGYINTAGTTITASLPLGITAGKWLSLGMTYNISNLKLRLWVQGLMAAEATGTGTIRTQDAGWRLMGTSASNALSVAGRMDYFYWFNTAITHLEINQIHRNPYVIVAPRLLRIQPVEYTRTAAPVDQSVSVQGIIEPDVLGTPVVSSALTIPVPSILATDVLGVPTIQSSLIIPATPIVRTISFGIPTVSSEITASPTSISVGSAVGIATVSSALTISSPSLAISTIFGTPSISSALTATLPSITSSVVLGVPTINAELTVSAPSISTGVVFGTLEVAVDTSITVSPPFIPEPVVFGVAMFRYQLRPVGFATGYDIGTPIVSSDAPSLTVNPSSITAGAQLGTAEITATATVSPLSISSNVQIGVPAISVGALTIIPTPLTAVSSFGTPTLTPGAIIASPPSIARSVQFGTPLISAGELSAVPSPITTPVTLGTSTVSVGTISASPTPTRAYITFGTVTITSSATVLPPSVVRVVQLGQPSVVLGEVAVSPVPITWSVVFGTPIVTPGALIIGVPSIVGGVTFGEIVRGDTDITLRPESIPEPVVFGHTQFRYQLRPEGFGIPFVFGDLRVESFNKYAFATPILLPVTLGQPELALKQVVQAGKAYIQVLTLHPKNRADPNDIVSAGVAMKNGRLEASTIIKRTTADVS
jgi:hypothetical protein